MAINLFYTPGHAAGYTDDLGIIADENQWVPAVYPGWYCYGISIGKHPEINDWCSKNLSGLWSLTRARLWISDDHDATLFKLTWCN